MDKNKVAERWSDPAVAIDAFSSDVYWLATPAVQARHQKRACGGMNYPSWVEYCLTEFAVSLPAARMLSVGCGHGALERHLHALGAFERCDAYDIAPAAIAQARLSAAAANISTIVYEQRDVEQMDFGRNVYDAVWFNGSLHHIAALESVLRRVREALTPQGLLFFNEYVGPNHFDFPPAQRTAITNAFHLLPDRYRRSFARHDYGQPVQHPPLPDPAAVRRADPSEAVRSADIIGAVAREFDFLTLNKAGGTLLQFLLSGIAGNFRDDDEHSMRLLRMLFQIEDSLIDSGTLESDFVIGVARPRREPARLSPAVAAGHSMGVVNDELRAEFEQLRADSAGARASIERLRQRLTKPV